MDIAKIELTTKDSETMDQQQQKNRHDGPRNQGLLTIDFATMAPKQLNSHNILRNKVLCNIAHQ